MTPGLLLHAVQLNAAAKAQLRGSVPSDDQDPRQTRALYPVGNRASKQRAPAIVMNLDEEVRLYTTSAEREKTENLATLYSIIVSLEYLERAYVRDSVTGKEWVA